LISFAPDSKPSETCALLLSDSGNLVTARLPQ
jgi:hypothetical protein